MAYSIGNTSGCHVNPAVSVAVWLNKGMSAKDFIGYVISQFIGAIAAAAVLKALIGGVFAALVWKLLNSVEGESETK